jgi:hypothetical protein
MSVHLEKLEEKIGRIHSKIAREDIETVLSRLILMGITPEEAILLVEKTHSAILHDLYFPISERE